MHLARNKPSKQALFLTLVAFLTLSQQQVMAGPVTATWVGPDNVNGNWSDATNWDTNPTYPNNGGGNTFDVLLMSNSVTHVLDTTATINSLTMSGSNSTLQTTGANSLTVNGSVLIGGSNNTIWANSGNVLVNDLNNVGGNLQIDSGNTLQSTGILTNLDSSGVLSNGNFNVGGTFQYAKDASGGSSTAIATIDASATVSLLNSGALITYNGTANALSGLSTNNGALSMNGGATLTTGDFVNNNYLMVSDPGTSLTTSSLNLGSVSFNQVVNGSVLNSGALTNNSSLTVSDAGTALNSTTVTNSSAGTFFVQNGAVLSGGPLSNSGFFGVQGISTATVTDLNNQGTLYVEAGSTVQSTGNFANLSSAGVLSNGSFQINGTLQYANDGAGNAGTGVAVIDSSANVSLGANGALITADGTSNALAGLNTNNGALSLNGGAVLSSGALSNTATGTLIVSDAGTSLATTSLTNSGQTYVQNGATLATGALNNSNYLLISDAGTFVNASSVTNSGAAYVQSGGTLTASGAVLNSGTLALSSGGSLSAASLTNSGTLTADSFSSTISLAGALQNNSGATLGLTNGASISADSVLNGGTLTVGGGSNSMGSGGSSLTTTGDFTNTSSGVFQVQSSPDVLSGGDGASATVGGNFANSGQVTIGAADGLGGATPTLSVTGNYVQTGAGSSTQVDGVLNALTVDIQGGILGGGGTINSNVDIESAGTIGPGDPAHMTINGNLTMDGTLDEEIGDPGSYTPNFDSIAVNGNINFDGQLTVDMLGGFVPALYQEYVILTWTGTAGDENLSIVDNAIPGSNLEWMLIWDNKDSELILEAVPEPASLLLLGSGLAALLARRKRRS
jgi:hypothetical protein